VAKAVIALLVEDDLLALWMHFRCLSAAACHLFQYAVVAAQWIGLIVSVDTQCDHVIPRAAVS